MRIRLLALAAAACLFGLLAVPASAHENEGGTYLALGDSVAFGYNPLLVPSKAGNPNVFVGYPNIVAKHLELHLVNASCPGETTGGFQSLTNGQDYRCLPYRSAFPLHVSYSTAQLAFAIQYLSTHHNVRLVTIDIGANDVFKLQTDICAGVPACISAGLPGVLAGIDANLRIIFNAIRNVAHYHGLLVTLSYYSLAYDPATAAGTTALNNPIIDATLAYGGRVASGFTAFQDPALDAGGSSCAAGLLIVLSPGHCDVHPTPLGRNLLARAIDKVVGESLDD